MLVTKVRILMFALQKIHGRDLLPVRKIITLGDMQMTNLFDYLVDAKQLKAIYGQEFPSLHDVDFHALDLHRDGPRALLKIDLPEFPKSPPQKWIDAGFNRVQLKLLGVGVHHFKMDGLQRNCKLTLSLFKEDDLIRLSGEGSGMSFDISTEHLLVDGLNPYFENKESS